MQVLAPHNIPLKELVLEMPVMSDFLESHQLHFNESDSNFEELISALPSSYWEEQGLTQNELLQTFNEFYESINALSEKTQIRHLTIEPGIDKSNTKETVKLDLIPGEITCIVGPTGSGKSRLLADIEWLADKDTPTKRTILINGDKPDSSLRNTYGGKLVAQITQNMNFVLDMTVAEFIEMHVQSHLIDNVADKVNEVLKLANELSGEPFNSDTPVTFLSGGQSRALMIADVACVGHAPIVLIDEIENAGVDKIKALNLLTSKEKIVIIATHDPLLILQADKRVVIKNGGMHKIIYTNEQEKALLEQLTVVDKGLQDVRNYFRFGNEFSNEVEFFQLD